MSFTIFISYAKENELQVGGGIKPYFESLGVRVLWDNNLGVNDVPPLGRLDAPIIRGIKQSDAVVILVSRFANTEWVKWEIEQANKYGKQVWPLAIDPVTPPGKARFIRYVDLDNPEEVRRFQLRVKGEITKKETNTDVIKDLAKLGALAAIILLLKKGSEGSSDDDDYDFEF